jgi:NADH-quinone oxidoreductase subunit N
MTRIQIALGDIGYQAPLLILAFTGVLLIVVEAFASGRRVFMMRLTLLGCVAAAVAAVLVWRQLGAEPRPLLGGMLVADRFGCWFAVLFAAVTALTALTSADYLAEHESEIGEYYALLLLSATGMVMLAMAGDLVTVFLGVETMSIGAYVLTASRRRSRRGAEAAMKYFLMGAFATGFLLYGIALVYGAAGTTDLAAIADRRDALASSPLLVTGIILLIVAFGFKIAAVPFHMWAPDAYEGAPTPITGFMAAGVKAGAFAAIIRVFGDTFGGDVLPYGAMGWASILAVLAVATMTVGNVGALRQENVKRMLAYSSIAQAGNLVIGVVAMGIGAGDAARPALLYYLAAYSVTTMGAFAVASWLGRRGEERLLIDDWAGLGTTHPGAALAMTVFLLSLGGIPPTAGFFGKLYVFTAAVQAHDGQLIWLVVAAVLNSLISIYYYLRIVTVMYFREPLRDQTPLASPSATFVFVACALLVMQMGMFPGFWLGLM